MAGVNIFVNELNNAYFIRKILKTGFGWQFASITS